MMPSHFLRPTLACTRTLATAVAAVLATGCALNSPPPVDMNRSTQPLSAQAITQAQQRQPQPEAQQVTGGLFNPNSYRPAFENRRARLVGDIVTINITERVSASQRQNSGVARENSATGSITRLPFLKPGASLLDKFSLGMNYENEFSGSGNTSSNNTFNGSITTTVTEVLPNGHLVVTGEKQIGLNNNVDVLRFTGTVDPMTLQPGSVVNSTQVANVRVESRSRGQAGAAQSIGWLSNFFLNFMPF